MCCFQILLPLRDGKNSSYVHKTEPWYQTSLPFMGSSPRNLWHQRVTVQSYLEQFGQWLLFSHGSNTMFFFLCQSQTVSMSGRFVSWEFLVFPGFSWNQSINVNKSFPQYRVSLVLVSGFYSPIKLYTFGDHYMFVLIIIP